MRNKTKIIKVSELDKIKELQTLTLKRKKLQQNLEILEYKIDQISPNLDEKYDQLDKVRKQLLYAKSALILSVLIIAVLFNRKSVKVKSDSMGMGTIPNTTPIPVNVKGFYK